MRGESQPSAARATERVCKDVSTVIPSMLWQVFPALLLPYASLKALRASKSQRRQRLLVFTVGLALWLSAGWLTQWTAPRWTILLDRLPASWPTDIATNWIAQVIQGLIASFLLGTSAALLRGKGEFQAIFWLLAATLGQLVLGGGWLYSVTAFPTLDQQIIHVMVRGLLFGLWILVAQRVCLTSFQQSWVYGVVGCLVGSGLILVSQSLPESWHGDARHLLLTATLWMTTVVAIGWIGWARFALIPLALALAALVSPTLATPALLPVSWGITAILLTLALLPLAAKQLARWQIALVFLLSFLAAAAANQLVRLSAPPDLYALAMLWCWTWLPALRMN